MASPDTHLLCLTREDLRQELCAFTEEVLRQQLVDLAANVQRDLRDELRRCLEDAGVGSNQHAGQTSQSSHSRGPNTFGQASFSSHEQDSPQMGQIPEAWPLVKESGEGLRHAGNAAGMWPLLKARKRLMQHKHIIRTNTLKRLECELDSDDEDEDEDVNIDSDDASDSGDKSSRQASPKVTPIENSNASTLKSVGASTLKSKSLRTTQEALKASAQHRRFEVKGPTLSFGVDFTRKRLMNLRARKIVKSPYFDMCVNLMILANAIYIGILTHFMALHKEEDIPKVGEVMETLFFVAFTCEMGLRVFVHGCELFHTTLPSGRTNQDIYWNILDCAVILLQSIEICFRYIRIDQSFTTRISVIRILRLARVVRIVRLLKVFRFIHDLRMIVYSIWRSLSIFLWSVIALISMTFMWSVYFTQVASDFVVVNTSNDDMLDIVVKLEDQFGSMTRTMLSLIQAVMGGIDWRDLTDNLAHVSWYLAVIPLVAYVTFAQLAMMNVITGVFLESAMSRAKKETEIYLVRNARKVFRAADSDQTGLIHWKDFERALQKEGVNDFFEAIDIDISEARTLFDLLDLSGDGVVSADEFLSGCLRVKGSAKALDLLVFSRQVEMLFANNRPSFNGSRGTDSNPLGDGDLPSDHPEGERQDAIS